MQHPKCDAGSPIEFASPRSVIQETTRGAIGYHPVRLRFALLLFGGGHGTQLRKRGQGMQVIRGSQRLYARVCCF